MPNVPKLTREERSERITIRKIFRRHWGASAEVASDLGLSETAISLWLSGKKNSEPVKTAMRIKAKQLLAEEAAYKEREEAERVVLA